MGTKNVWEWMRGGDEVPTNAELAEAVIAEVREWQTWTDDGMDVVASSCLDNAIEILTAMRELV